MTHAISRTRPAADSGACGLRWIKRYRVRMCTEKPEQSSSGSDPVQATIRFHGRVQGVGFRVTVSRLADQFPVDGFVRNEPDGSVQMVAQGEPTAIEALLDAIRAAFPGHISDEERVDDPARERFDGFSIRQ